MSKKNRNKKKNKKKKKKQGPLIPCKHHYAYCYFDKQNKISIYQCVLCGKFSYT